MILYDRNSISELHFPRIHPEASLRKRHARSVWKRHSGAVGNGSERDVSHKVAAGVIDFVAAFVRFLHVGIFRFRVAPDDLVELGIVVERSLKACDHVHRSRFVYIAPHDGFIRPCFITRCPVDRHLLPAHHDVDDRVDLPLYPVLLTRRIGKVFHDVPGIGYVPMCRIIELHGAVYAGELPQLELVIEIAP